MDFSKKESALIKNQKSQLRIWRKKVHFFYTEISPKGDLLRFRALQAERVRLTFLHSKKILPVTF